MPRPALKICGLRQPAQAAAVAALGVEAIGVIAVPASPRFLPPELRPELFAAAAAAHPGCRGVLVVADPSTADLAQLGSAGGHQVLQLHGEESVERCGELRRQLDVELWKALRIRCRDDLQKAWIYAEVVDAVLLDAWVPDQLGGTGHRLPLEWIEDFAPPSPWWLAGGVSPESAAAILERVKPSGLDASSGVEHAPGDKNLERVTDLLRAMQQGCAGGGG